MPHADSPAPPRPRPLTFARVFWHFCVGGLGASTIGLVLVPRLLHRAGVGEARILAWSVYVWLGLLVLALAPLGRDLVREWRELEG